jgi:hypothetical protein
VSPIVVPADHERHEITPAPAARRCAAMWRIAAVSFDRVLHPVGPLPASVYWRRRLLVLGGALVVLAVVWSLAAGGGRPRASNTASVDPSRTPASGGASPSASTSSPSGTVPESISATPPAADPGRPTGGSEGAATTSAAGRGNPTGPCTDAALRLTVAPHEPSYPVGQMPVVMLTVHNASRSACTRDLGAALQEVLLYEGTKRLWSSNDCYPGGAKDVRTLRAGEKVRFWVRWSGLSSRPGCEGERRRVGPGRYALIGRLGTLSSPRAPLVMR